MDRFKVSDKPRSAWKTLAALWTVGLVLALIFAGDLHSTAELSDESELSDAVSATTGVIEELSVRSGADQIQRVLRIGRDALYKDPVVVGTIDVAADSIAKLGTEPDTDVSSTLDSSLEPSKSLEFPPPNDATTALQAGAKKILLAGASSIQFGLGRALERRLETYPQTEIRRFGRYSTGLARPDYFDWMDKADELAEEFLPNLVIAQIGGNDCQSLTDLEGKLVARFGTPEWNKTFGERVREFIQLFRSRGARVVILGMPIMRSPRFRQKIESLNAVTANICSEESVDYISLWDITKDRNGEYRHSFLYNGRERTLRGGDGIHMSLHGALFAAEKITDELEELAWISAPVASGSGRTNIGF
jgi:hypothetical protein